MNCVIIASGESLSDSDIELVRLARESGKIETVIAVSNVGIDKTPWADALVSHDSKWWFAYPESSSFKGRKFSRSGLSKTEAFKPSEVAINNGINSGLLAMFVARDIYKSKRIFLLGFDMKGSHYFGLHDKKVGNRPLKNSTEKDFSRHLSQFVYFKGCEVYNCTKESGLKLYPYVDLEEALDGV